MVGDVARVMSRDWRDQLSGPSQCSAVCACRLSCCLIARTHPPAPSQGLGANHLRTVAYQAQFNSKLARLLDQTIPTLGYRPPPYPAAATRGSIAKSPVPAPKAPAVMASGGGGTSDADGKGDGKG